MDKPFPAYVGDEPYVFVCYAHEDDEVVYPEISWLRDQGINIWYDEGISAGKVWRRELAEAIQGASKLVYYISKASLRSEHCNREIEYALDKEVEVVPVYLDETELTPELDLALNRVQALHRDQDASYQQHLLNALGQSVSTQSQTVASSVQRQFRWSRYAGLGLILTAVIGATWLYSVYRDVTTAQTIAVLPFTSLSVDKEIEFFARGLSENILTNLAQRQAVLYTFQRRTVLNPYSWVKPDVASGTASFQLADSGEDPSIIAEKLDVAYLLDGSVELIGEILRITAQLIRAEDGFQIWSKSYELALGDEFVMRAGVAQNIAFVAESALSFDTSKRFAFVSAFFLNTNTAAYKHFLNAESQLRLIRLGEGGDWALRERLLLQAIKADPDFSMAYEMLTNTYVNRVGGSMSFKEASLNAHAAISRAIELNPDPTVPQVVQLGQIYLNMDLDYAKAEATFLGCGDRFPNVWLCPFYLATVALREGRTEMALRLMETASELNAGFEQALFLNTHAWYLLIAGDYEQSLRVSAKALNLSFGGPTRARTLNVHAGALIRLGRSEEARPLIEESWDLDKSVNPGAHVWRFVKIGEIERARNILGDSRATANGYLALGDTDNTFKEIQAAIEDRSILLIDSFPTAEWWNPIRDDPRFDDMLELLDSKVTHTQTYLNNLESRR